MVFFFVCVCVVWKLVRDTSDNNKRRQHTKTEKKMEPISWVKRQLADKRSVCEIRDDQHRDTHTHKEEEEEEEEEEEVSAPFCGYVNEFNSRKKKETALEINPQTRNNEIGDGWMGGWMDEWEELLLVSTESTKFDYSGQRHLFLIRREHHR